AGRRVRLLQQRLGGVRGPERPAPEKIAGMNHEAALRTAIAAEGEAYARLLAGEPAGEALRRAAAAYRASWETAPPRSFGRLVGFAKASVLAGEDPSAYVRAQVGDEGDSPASWWVLALAALAAGDDALAARAAEGMRGGSDAFDRAADAVAALAAG